MLYKCCIKCYITLKKNFIMNDNGSQHVNYHKLLTKERKVIEFIVSCQNCFQSDHLRKYVSTMFFCFSFFKAAAYIKSKSKIIIRTVEIECEIYVNSAFLLRFINLLKMARL